MSQSSIGLCIFGTVGLDRRFVPDGVLFTGLVRFFGLMPERRAPVISIASDNCPCASAVVPLANVTMPVMATIGKRAEYFMDRSLRVCSIGGYTKSPPSGS